MEEPHKILIIDDEEESLELLKLNLEYFGFKVVTALGGFMGLMRAFNEHPDAIVLDIHMPDMDGWEVCRKLTVNSKTQNIPIVFLTALWGPNDFERAKALDVKECLTKPVNPEKLAVTLNAILSIAENSKQEIGKT
jgi:CheY-like chemotaxis protein